MKHTLSEKLGMVAPAPPPTLSLDGQIIDTVDDLTRILKLPKRAPYDCQRDPVTKRYPPATAALIEVMTARFARAKRLTCACRPRRVIAGEGGTLTIFRVLPEGAVPEPPLVTTVAAFRADNQANSEEERAAQLAVALRPGQELLLPAFPSRPRDVEEPGAATGHPCISVLNAVQAWTLWEAPQVGGITGFAGVGSGKSMSALLIPLAFPDGRLAVLAIEPKQRSHFRSQYLRLREHFRSSSIVFDDGAPGYTVPGTTPLHLISYSVLSQLKNSDMLDVRSPDILILDEAHRALGASAIGRRIRRFFLDKIKEREAAIMRGEQVRGRAVRLFNWSGTLESKSVIDTQMLCAYSLGTGSPLPLDPKEAEAWTGVIDTSYKPDYKSPTAKKLQRAFGGGEVCDDDILLGGGSAQEAVRQGFSTRRRETLGVISASAPDINAAIYLSKREPKLPKVVRDALARVRNDNIRPDGELIVEQVEQIATARHVACGFYNYWAFPNHPCNCVKTSDGSVLSRCAECLLIDMWFALRKTFNKELRAKLLLGEVYLDSPKLCEEAAERHYQKPAYAGKLPVWACEAWPAWRDIRDRVEHEERVRWLGHDLPEAADPKTHPGYFLARDAAKWAKENRGVVWFQSIALGRKISELSGLPYFNGGPGGEERLRAERGDRSIICSIKAVGAGIDGLQNLFSDQYIVETPASNASQTGLEQLLGRLHREGQVNDVVNTLLAQHSREFKSAFWKAFAQAEFNFQMTQNTQKLLLADLDFDIDDDDDD